jgi:hypothetical protein
MPARGRISLQGGTPTCVGYNKIKRAHSISVVGIPLAGVLTTEIECTK